MTQATHQPALFVLVADALSARLLHREPDGSLLERWQLYAADRIALFLLDQMRTLLENQSVSYPEGYPS